MKISEQMQDLTNKAQELLENDYPFEEYFVTVTCFAGDGYFKVWFDQWERNGVSPIHSGMFLDVQKSKTLVGALNKLETVLDEYETSTPEIISHNGRFYKLVNNRK